MRFLRSLDLYKFIVLLAAVLLPLGWWWVRSLDESIRLCRQAITEASKTGGVKTEPLDDDVAGRASA